MTRPSRINADQEAERLGIDPVAFDCVEIAEVTGRFFYERGDFREGHAAMIVGKRIMKIFKARKDAERFNLNQ